MGRYTGISTVSENDVSRRRGGGEEEKRRMSLEHVGWSGQQWCTEDSARDESNCFSIRPVTPRWLTRTVVRDDSDSCFDMPDDLETRESTPTVYFGYGSNMWLDQMNRRCPENKYIGTAVLHDWWA